MSPNKEFWSSSKGFVLAMAGSAIGLGNIWRFSYIMGKYGGAAFMLVYLAAIFLIGLTGRPAASSAQTNMASSMISGIW